MRIDAAMMSLVYLAIGILFFAWWLDYVRKKKPKPLEIILTLVATAAVVCLKLLHYI